MTKNLNPDSSVPVYEFVASEEHVAEIKKNIEDQPLKVRKEVEDARKAAYQQIADPVFFQYQAGEATEQEWLEARASVVTAHPYPQEETK
jgi:hypothetical protein